MGTNYYFKIKNPKFAHKHFATEYSWGFSDQEYKIIDDPNEIYYLVHLNKLSYGWKPLFQRHNAFHCFKDLKRFYNKYTQDLIIQNEYLEELTWQEYEETVVNHGNRNPKPMKWVYKEDTFFGNNHRKYLQVEECEPEEADLWIPFNHEEYTHTEAEAAQRFGVSSFYNEIDCKYNADPTYNIDWTDGEFS